MQRRPPQRSANRPQRRLARLKESASSRPVEGQLGDTWRIRLWAESHSIGPRSGPTWVEKVNLIMLETVTNVRRGRLLCHIAFRRQSNNIVMVPASAGKAKCSQCNCTI